MRFKSIIWSKKQRKENMPYPQALPRFSFESHERPLLSTQCLARITTQYDGFLSYETDYKSLEAHDEDEEIIIQWDTENDPASPYNWPQRQKWVVTLLVSLFTFISPFSSTMVTPALPTIASDLGVPSGFKTQLVMTIFLLGYAQGPFVLAPISEVYGRVGTLQYANLIYLIFNTACGFAKTQNQMLAFRFLSGIGGAAPQALCNGVLADVWRKEERGRGQSIYGILTFIAPCVAPICAAAIISQGVKWQWIFFSTSIFTVFVQVAALFFLQETYAPTILARKAKVVRKALKDIRPNAIVRTEYETGDRMSKILRKRLVLPFIMMFTHPATQAPAVYRAYLYGVMYLMLSTFPMVFEQVYKMSIMTASLNHLSLCLGFLIGLQISHRLMDGLYARLKAYYEVEEGLPEFRVPPMIIAGILCPVGLFIYGWTTQNRVHWIVPNIGAVLLAIGLILGFQCSQAYTTDAYEAQYAASAAAVSAFLRTMFGFALPLGAPRMFEVLGLGWGHSLLAFLTLLLALLSPVLLWFYGPKLRALSTRGLNNPGQK